MQPYAFLALWDLMFAWFRSKDTWENINNTIPPICYPTCNLTEPFDYFYLKGIIWEGFLAMLHTEQDNKQEINQ